MTADLGMGANIAIESAVYLCNILHREFASDSTRHISTPDLTAVFAEYQAGRHERAIDYVETSGKLTRMNSYQTYFDRLFWPYILKYIAPFQSAGLAESLADGPKLDYAPTRTIDEGAEGWHLGKGKKKEEKGSWSMYLVLISLVGITAAYLVTRELPVLL
jgi:FAD dependent monooxygenase